MADSILPRTVTAISLWEPWASLMRAGSKRVETRSWYTSHAGPLLICAAKKQHIPSLCLLRDPAFQRGLRPILHSIEALPYPSDLSFGMAVALVDLVEVARTDARPARWEHLFTADELAFGDYSPRRFAWITKNLRTFDPFPVTGRQGLFKVELPSEVHAALVGKDHP